MVSQAVFGEIVTVIAADGDYSLIRSADDYEGWALTAHIWPEHSTSATAERVVTERVVTERVVMDAFAQILAMPDPSVDPNVANYAEVLTTVTRFSMGSRVRVLGNRHGFTQISLPSTAAFGTEVGLIANRCLGTPQNADCSTWQTVQYCANQLLGTPYLWGGTSAFGIDCSGFVQRVFGASGILLPRDAYQQASSSLGQRTSDTETPAAMDIVFFLGREDPRQRGITHVGVARDSNRFYHSSSISGVVIASFDDVRIREEYRYMGGLRLVPGRVL
jgi:cell wall-associated NlpC family hydrolase